MVSACHMQIRQSGLRFNGLPNLLEGVCVASATAKADVNFASQRVLSGLKPHPHDLYKALLIVN